MEHKTHDGYGDLLLSAGGEKRVRHIIRVMRRDDGSVTASGNILGVTLDVDERCRLRLDEIPEELFDVIVTGKNDAGISVTVVSGCTRLLS